MFKKKLYIAYLINTIIMLITALNYFDYVTNVDYLLAKLYYISAYIGHFMLIAVIPLLIGLLIYLITKNKKITTAVFGFLSILSFIILKIDILVYSQFRFHISPFVLNMAFGKNASDIFHLDTTNTLKIIAGIILIILSQVLILYLAKKITEKRKEFYIKYTLCFTTVLLIISHLIFAWSDANVYTPITQSKSIFPLYYPLTAQSLLEKLNLTNKELIAKNKKLYQLDNHNIIKYPLSIIKSEPKKEKKNILFLVIDSWRYDCMDSIITPNIYKIAQQSQQFNQHHSGSNATADGMFTLFYGISGLCNDNFTNHKIVPAIMTESKKQQYQFNILGSATLENPPFDQNIFINVDKLRLNAVGETPSDRDIDITNVWLDSQNKKDTLLTSFDLLFYDSAHGYDYPLNYPEIFSPAVKSVDYANLDNDYNPNPLLNRYKNSLHFIDSQIGRVYRSLIDNNRLENTIIIITSDHGQEFNNNKKGYWNHGGNYTKHQTQTPLFIFDAKKTPKKYNHLSLHYDISSTLMQDYLGVINPISNHSIGKSLYNTEKRNWFLCGFKNSYAIVEPNKITKINKTLGLYTVTDDKLNPLKDQNVNYQIIQETFKDVNRFYKETK